VRKFTIDNDVSVEFDPFGFFVKDLQTGMPLMRCDSSGDLYLLTTRPPTQLSQRKYTEEIIKRASMSSCKLVSTLVDTKENSVASQVTPIIIHMNIRVL